MVKHNHAFVHRTNDWQPSNATSEKEEDIRYTYTYKSTNFHHALLGSLFL